MITYHTMNRVCLSRIHADITRNVEILISVDSSVCNEVFFLIFAALSTLDSGLGGSIIGGGGAGTGSVTSLGSATSLTSLLSETGSQSQLFPQNLLAQTQFPQVRLLHM